MRVLRLIALPLSLGVGVALGLAATEATLRGRPPFGAVRSGPWTAWPDTGTPGADPYQRALDARDGRIPLTAAAGLRFTAERDTDGRPLDGRCSYLLGGAALPATLWTLTLLDPQGRERQTPDPRQGFTSTELVRDPEGEATITLARQARPGNWLPTRGDGPFILMLSLYDTPLGSALLAGGPVPAMPSIARTACP